MGGTSLTSGVLNETTGTIHKREITTGMRFETVCGAIHNVSKGSLRPAEVETLVDLRHTDKCGRCFDDGRGY